MEATSAPADLVTREARPKRGVRLWVILVAMTAVQVAVVAVFAPMIF